MSKLMSRIVSINIYFLVVVTLPDCRSSDQVCDTQACKKIASSIQKNMDEEIDQCDDFYKYACGNYMIDESVPNGLLKMNPIDQINGKILTQLRNYVEKRHLNHNQKLAHQLEKIIDKHVNKKAPSFLDKFSLYYKSCMNREKMAKSEKAQVMKLIQKLGGWPVLNKTWDQNRFDWIETMYAFRDEGLDQGSFINIFYEPDMRTNTLAISLDESRLSGLLHPEVLVLGTNHVLVQQYFNFMVNIAVALGADRIRAKKELRESLDFEIKMARIIKPPKFKQDPVAMYNPMTIGELYKRYNKCPVQWETYLTKILRPPVQLSMSDKVNVRVPEFLTYFCDLLKNVKSKRVLANYALWTVVSQYTSTLGPKARQLTKDWRTMMSGNPVEMEKWKECMMSAKRQMHLAAGAIYVQKIYGKNVEKTKKQASEMVDLIRKEMRKSLEKEGWMDDSTRSKAMKKLNKMKFSVAYPIELLDDKKLNEIYRNLTIDKNSYLKSSLRLNRLRWDLSARKYKKLIEKNSWFGLFGDPSSVNAFYQPPDNAFMLLAGILQEPYFNTDYPRYINYAGIGSVIGHEMSHGFDVIGRKFDENGKPSDWWDKLTESIFLNKTKCFIKQYEDYGLAKNIPIDGRLTLAENLADNVGLKQTYAAYSEWVKNNTDKEPRLPGLEKFTPQQMFWLTYANSHCSKTRPGSPPAVQMMDPHAPNHLRVLGTLSNIPEFARDFKCPPTSFMNQPDKRCSIW